ncbi:hypothetical protein [Verminephrobacter eiseniae]|uniref:hypothetical protein n=1 Tax=Verminephrobacter eiseniae TaxID=364317 RepID=UPI0012EE078D|nr:hypothetical protein [Verminephrobacter eiseniae]MCW5287151.1 hypothetical protein [Verminephrobacter eiseniae]MCW8189406.1 hypothetical protein [Verminephrobacter eiseniae]
MSRHRSSVGLRWPSKRIAALHRLPIRSVLAARCALRCAPMAARSLRHLIRDATLGRYGYFTLTARFSRTGSALNARRLPRPARPHRGRVAEPRLQRSADRAAGTAKVDRMSRNKKPRKTYRARPVTAHTVALAMHYAAKPAQADRAQVLGTLAQCIRALRALR